MSIPLKSAKQRKKIATTEERAVATTLGGRKTFASGSGDFEKGDGIVKGKFAIENKTTDHACYSIRNTEYGKIFDHARSKRLEPVFTIRMKAAYAYQRLALLRFAYVQVLGLGIPQSSAQMSIQKSRKLTAEECTPHLRFALFNMERNNPHFYDLVALPWERFMELLEEQG